MYLVFTRMPGECYCRWLRSLSLHSTTLLCVCAQTVSFCASCFLVCFLDRYVIFFNAQSTMIVTFGQIRLLSVVKPLLLIYMCIDWCSQRKVVNLKLCSVVCLYLRFQRQLGPLLTLVFAASVSVHLPLFLSLFSRRTEWSNNIIVQHSAVIN